MAITSTLTTSFKKELLEAKNIAELDMFLDDLAKRNGTTFH